MTDFIIIEHDDTEIIEVVSAGAQGPQGVAGPTGATGSAGPTGPVGPMGDVTPEALAAVEDAEAAAIDAAQSADEAQAAADYVAGASGSRDTKSVSSLLADNTFTYTADLPGTVITGDIIRTRTEGFAYSVAASAATDHHLITAGGIKLYCIPTSGGVFNFAQMNPDKTGVADCWDKLDKLLKYATGIYPATGWYRAGPAIYFPPGMYYMSQTVEIKHHTVRLYGDTSYGIGSNILKWPAGVMGIVVDGHNTLNGGTEPTPTSSARGVIIEGLTLYGTVVTGPGGTSKSSHAVWARTVITVMNCQINDWGGNGINITAAAGSGGSGEGNANGWQLRDLFIFRVENGVYIDGPDANAGMGFNLNFVYCRRWAIWDSSFLGNTWIACQCADCGRETNAAGTIEYNKCGCTYLGVNYQLHPSSAVDAGITTTPGTNSNVWYPNTPTLFAKEWTGLEPSGYYRPGGSYLCDNINAAAVLMGNYTEQGLGLTWLLGPQLSVGGMGQGGVGTFIGGITGGTLGTSKLKTTYRSSTVSGLTTNVTLNETDNYFLSMETQGGATPTGVWRLKAAGDGLVLDHNNAGVQTPLSILGSTGNYTYKLSCSPGIVLGAGSTVNLISKSWQPTFPTTGTFFKGDILFIQQASAGAKAGIICTTAGVAGSTAVFKLFGAIDA